MSGYNQSRGPTVFLAPPGAYARSAAFGGNSIGQTAEIGFFAPEAGLTRPTLADMPNMPLATVNGWPNVMMYQGVDEFCVIYNILWWLVENLLEDH